MKLTSELLAHSEFVKITGLLWVGPKGAVVEFNPENGRYIFIDDSRQILIESLSDLVYHLTERAYRLGREYYAIEVSKTLKKLIDMK